MSKEYNTDYKAGEESITAPLTAKDANHLREASSELNEDNTMGGTRNL